MYLKTDNTLRIVNCLIEEKSLKDLYVIHLISDFIQDEFLKNNVIILRYFF